MPIESGADKGGEGGQFRHLGEVGAGTGTDLDVELDRLLLVLLLVEVLDSVTGIVVLRARKDDGSGRVVRMRPDQTLLWARERERERKTHVSEVLLLLCCGLELVHWG